MHVCKHVNKKVRNYGKTTLKHENNLKNKKYLLILATLVHMPTRQYLVHLFIVLFSYILSQINIVSGTCFNNKKELNNNI